MIDVQKIITFRRLAEITGLEDNLLRTWERREVFRRIRSDLPLMDGEAALRAIAERQGLDPGPWLGKSFLES